MEGRERKTLRTRTDRQTDTMRHNETARSRPPLRPDPRKNRRALRCQNAAGVGALGGEQGVSPTTPRSHQQPLKSSGRGAKGTWGVWCLHGTRPPQAQRHLYLRLGGVLLQSPLIPLDEDPLLLSAGLAGVPHPTHPPRAWWATGPGFWPGSAVRTPGVIFGGIPGFPPPPHPSHLQADRLAIHLV